MYQGDAKCQIVDLGTEWSEDVVVPSEPSVEADDWGRLLTKHGVDPLLVTAKETSKTEVLQTPSAIEVNLVQGVE